MLELERILVILQIGKLGLRDLCKVTQSVAELGLELFLSQCDVFQFKRHFLIVFIDDFFSLFFDFTISVCSRFFPINGVDYNVIIFFFNCEIQKSLV